MFHARFEVPPVVNIQTLVFWNVRLYSLVDSNQRSVKHAASTFRIWDGGRSSSKSLVRVYILHCFISKKSAMLFHISLCFYFFLRLCGPFSSALASLRITMHSFMSWTFSLHLFVSRVYMSASTSSNHLSLGLPTPCLLSGLVMVYGYCPFWWRASAI